MSEVLTTRSPGHHPPRTPARLPAAALIYAGRGWPVFPLKGRAKTPLTRHGFHDATTEPTQVQEWWARWPRANIGIACGHACDVLDVDGPDGRAALHQLLQDLAVTPAGWVASLSGRPDGGRHYWFAPTGRERIRGLRPHLDWLGHKGYVIAPPSVHPSGRVYRWQGPLPDQLPALPAALTQAFVDHQAARARPPIDLPPAARDGSRPGDDYNRRAHWPQLLEPLGWRVTGRLGAELRLTRPGKPHGPSATVNHHGRNELYVFSSDPACQPFEPDREYSLFAAYTLLHHAGDYAAAARALRDQGYGQ